MKNSAKNRLPFVSIVVPCRNEEKYIEKCLDSILENDYSKDKLEIIVADGGSIDKTREIVNGFSQKYSFIRLLDNPKTITPSGLNLGINSAKGEIIMIMSAHGKCDKNYISTCVKYLLQKDVDSVGGLYLTLPRNDGFIANAVALALSSSFGVGNAYYRTGIKGLKKVDTVAWGCYKKDVFDKVGLFDKEFVSCEDDEFNYRLRERGGKLLLTSDTKSYYYARNSLKKLWQQYFTYGFWKVRVFQKHPKMMQVRQFIPGTFVFVSGISLILGIFYTPFRWFFGTIVLSYLICSLFYSFRIAKKHRWKYFGIMPVTFSILHLAYGTGFLTGLVRFIGRWGKIIKKS